MARRSQREVIENHLRTKKHITSFEAFEMYGITRLSDIIFRIRKKKEMEIRSVNRTEINRYGNRVDFAEYTLIEDNYADSTRMD